LYSLFTIYRWLSKLLVGRHCLTGRHNLRVFSFMCTYYWFISLYLFI